MGIDADAASMRDAARRAAAKPARGGCPNALFVQCAAEEMAEFAGAADEVVVQFPWGSLLRAVIGEAPAILDCIAATLRPGGTLRVIFSVEPRDGVSAPSDEQLHGAYASASLTICSIRPLDAAGARSIRSSWARRLGAGSRRPAVVVEARRSA